MIGKLLLEINNHFLTIILLVIALTILIIKVKKLRYVRLGLLFVAISILSTFIILHDLSPLNTKDLYSLYIVVHYSLMVIRWFSGLLGLVYLSITSILAATISSSIFILILASLIGGLALRFVIIKVDLCIKRKNVNDIDLLLNSINFNTDSDNNNINIFNDSLLVKLNC